ncbi:hypothetical protein FA15DRAFT_721694 [Coprinopsis marcescibilis]|uniref:Uncharacterized protein n=1 Tax=Coprinopsis marcescibilis TaxID=230819 RepID=A0A5C3KJP0_COPMA|nr:hypothetical protein FA15DRAFT_721694 [Coprinopsis marcescibilis]
MPISLPALFLWFLIGRVVYHDSRHKVEWAVTSVATLSLNLRQGVITGLERCDDIKTIQTASFTMDVENSACDVGPPTKKTSHVDPADNVLSHFLARIISFHQVWNCLYQLLPVSTGKLNSLNLLTTPEKTVALSITLLKHTARTLHRPHTLRGMNNVQRPTTAGSGNATGHQPDFQNWAIPGRNHMPLSLNFTVTQLAILLGNLGAYSSLGPPCNV